MTEHELETPEIESPEAELEAGSVTPVAAAPDLDEQAGPETAAPLTEEDETTPSARFEDVDPDELYADFDAPAPLDLGFSFAPATPVESAIGTPTDSGEATPAVGTGTGDERQWYVIHCYSGYENKVRHAIEQRIETMGMRDQIFDVVVPTEEEIEVKDGKRRTVESRVFPGYILVQMVLGEESWYVVRNTPGVTGFVGMGNTPTPLRPEEVNQIIRRMEAEAPKIKVTYKSGQKVRIIDGPFNDFIGTVDNIDVERAKVRVMVSFFGRETPVELDLLQVDKI